MQLSWFDHRIGVFIVLLLNGAVKMVSKRVDMSEGNPCRGTVKQDICDVFYTKDQGKTLFWSISFQPAKRETVNDSHMTTRPDIVMLLACFMF